MNKAFAFERASLGISLARTCAREQPCLQWPDTWNFTHIGALCVRLCFLGIRVSVRTGHPLSPGILALNRSRNWIPGGSFHSGTTSLLTCEALRSMSSEGFVDLAFCVVSALVSLTDLFFGVVDSLLVVHRAIGSTMLSPCPSSSFSISSSAFDER